MRATFVLGRIAGVRVGVHWSVLVILGIIAFGLAQGRLPGAYPGDSPALYWLTGIVTAVVFLASLLAHELAHAVVARRNGVDVQDIVLWLLGGVTQMTTEAPAPGAEVRIAGVGPLVSLVLGGVFALLAWLTAQVAGIGLPVEALAWLAGINVLLAVFNSVPAAPLDGGRLLRAFLWWRTGDRVRATVGATRAGRVFGWFLVLAGFVLFLRSGNIGDLWLTLIGWFLIAAATMEGRQAGLREALSGVPVGRAMTPDPITAHRWLSVGDFLADPRYRFRHSSFPVTDVDGAPVGLVTLTLARQVPQERRTTVTVGDVMLPLSRVTVVGAGDPLVGLLSVMRSGAEHRALVLDAGRRLVGIVSLSDISRTVAWLTDPHARKG
ncbi:site-2 protease family protein [Streptomyces sp. NPDC058001]|uniref:site-2 protease family protein n=1 Tax=Streptomyces sp. NPDC058001 TaxID=3346300 RepID=UPI0036EA7438